MGRNPKEFDKKMFESFCSLQCTESEICGQFDTTDKTLNAWCERTYGMDFSECFKKYSSPGKISLRRAQYRLAVEKLNPTMLIWLGRQWLGQTENNSVQLSVTEADPLSLAFESFENGEL